MIDKNSKKRILRIIGKRYVAPVKEQLIKMEAFNSKGEEYSSSQITNVMNGTPHRIIEQAIYKVVEIKKQELEQEKEQRQKILTGKVN